MVRHQRTVRAGRKADLGQRSVHPGAELRVRVEQRGDEHVAGDTAERIEVQVHWKTARISRGERRRGDRIGSRALLRAVQSFMQRFLFYHRCLWLVSGLPAVLFPDQVREPRFLQALHRHQHGDRDHAGEAPNFDGASQGDTVQHFVFRITQ